ncbi:transcription antitermination factor NusB [Lactonifactor longoviformis]|uniref:Transcription antitermination protein NusB n=1 Tax=Lactonifactor longoviformis DSM 17459 TaxID=1122155 RepID=A0A1M4VIN2_9CLOT|nr:transcription antitermination factor NusB [Lactonifactor longoviformis]POP32236.1 transcription antitermination factor NusB [Lactonifactor longoviformis]SHE68838.1 NusB antitermination factor [Lactonifactor longoviformis DSM 17459]
MGRRELRENIFKLLFVSEFNTPEEMPEQISLYFEQLGELSQKDQMYMEEKYKKVRNVLDEIDSLINEAAKGWKTSRMGKVDLTILRLAVYEMNYDPDVPVKVAINEAIEIGKRFGQDESAAFINGILGNIAKEKE